MGLALALAFISLTLVPFGGLSQAAPPAVPTVVAAPDTTGKGVVIPFQAATALIADTGTTPIETLNFKTMDIEFTIDQGTVNTTTLTVQYSIAGSVWEDGVVLASANAADATDLIVRVPVYGRWIRVNQDVTSADPITISITSVARP